MTLQTAEDTAFSDAAIEKEKPAGISAGMTFLMAAAAGLICANIYYAQPLAGPIAASIGLPAEATGLIVTLTQIGYGLGLLFVVPLGDLVENRRLILSMMALVTLALLAAAVSSTPSPFLAASLMIGLGSVAVQVIVPFAASLAPEESRGRVVGNVVSGLMLGIMLARPVSSFIAEFSSWHTVFYLSAAVMVVLAVVLALKLPTRRPETSLNYISLLGSMVSLVLTQPVLRRRAAYQFCQFASFSLFWTVTPLLLAGPAFGLSQAGIALFALAGVAGAIASPIAGRLADRDLGRRQRHSVSPRWLPGTLSPTSQPMAPCWRSVCSRWQPSLSILAFPPPWSSASGQSTASMPACAAV